jgi:cardiolipin synthase
MTDQAIEQEIQAKGLTAPRITPADIEANIVSEDRALARQLQTKLDHAIEHGALELRGADWQRRGWPRRLVSWAAYGVVRWMVGIAGFQRWM